MTFDEFKNKNYKDHKLVEYTADRDGDLSVRQISSSLKTWYMAFSMKEEYDKEPFFCSEKLEVDEKLEVTEQLAAVVQSKEFMLQLCDDLFSNIETEVLETLSDRMAINCINSEE